MASQIYPEYSHLLYLQGGLAEHDQDFVVAEDFYRRSAAINPTGPAVLNLANLLSIHGRFAEAEPLLRTVVDLAPLDEYVIRYAYTEIVLGKPEVALEIIQRYYGNDLHDPERSAVVGTAYFQLGKYPEAIQYLEQAKQLGKSAPELDRMIEVAKK